jgi:hypothetical protein
VAERQTPLRDSALVWLGVGGLVAVLAAWPLGAGIAQAAAAKSSGSLWSNGWFGLGAAFEGVGVLALIYSLALVMAHHHVQVHERYRCPDPAAHDEKPPTSPPVAEPAATAPPIAGPPVPSRAVVAPTKALLRERRAAMREVLAELTAGREIIEPSIESGTIWSAWNIPQDKAWKRHRKTLLDALSLPEGERVDDAYWHIDRLSGRRGGASLSYLVFRQQFAKRITPSDRLDEAVAAIRAAEAVLSNGLKQSNAEEATPELERAKAVREEIKAITKAADEELAKWKPGSAGVVSEEPWQETETPGTEWSCAHRLTNQGFALRLTRPSEIDYETYLKKCVVRYHPPARVATAVERRNFALSAFVAPVMIEVEPEDFAPYEVGYDESRSDGPWELEFPAQFPNAINLLPLRRGTYTYTWIADLYIDGRQNTRIVAEGTVHWKK